MDDSLLSADIITLHLLTEKLQATDVGRDTIVRISKVWVYPKFDVYAVIFGDEVGMLVARDHSGMMASIGGSLSKDRVRSLERAFSQDPLDEEPGEHPAPKGAMVVTAKKKP